MNFLLTLFISTILSAAHCFLPISKFGRNGFSVLAGSVSCKSSTAQVRSIERLKTERKNFEIPALLSHKQENLGWEKSKLYMRYILLWISSCEDKRVVGIPKIFWSFFILCIYLFIIAGKKYNPSNI